NICQAISTSVGSLSRPRSDTGAFFLARRSSGLARRRAKKLILTIGDTSYDVGLHDRSRNRARNWVHSRIWPSRDYFLSTPSTRKTAIVPLKSCTDDGTGE